MGRSANRLEVIDDEVPMEHTPCFLSQPQHEMTQMVLKNLEENMRGTLKNLKHELEMKLMLAQRQFEAREHVRDLQITEQNTKIAKQNAKLDDQATRIDQLEADMDLLRCGHIISVPVSSVGTGCDGGRCRTIEQSCTILRKHEHQPNYI